MQTDAGNRCVAREIVETVLHRKGIKERKNEKPKFNRLLITRMITTLA